MMNTVCHTKLFSTPAAGNLPCQRQRQCRNIRHLTRKAEQLLSDSELGTTCVAAMAPGRGGFLIQKAGLGIKAGFKTLNKYLKN